MNPHQGEFWTDTAEDFSGSNGGPSPRAMGTYELTRILSIARRQLKPPPSPIKDLRGFSFPKRSPDIEPCECAFGSGRGPVTEGPPRGPQVSLNNVVPLD